MKKQDKERTRTAFGQRLYDAREARRPQLNVTAAARIFGWAQSSWDYLETKANKSTDIVKISKLLDIHPAWLELGVREARGIPYPDPRASRLTGPAMMLAILFDRLPHETPTDIAVRERLYKGFIVAAGVTLDEEKELLEGLGEPVESVDSVASDPVASDILHHLNMISDPARRERAGLAAMHAIRLATSPEGGPAIETKRAVVPKAAPRPAPAPPKKKASRQPSPHTTRKHALRKAR